MARKYIDSGKLRNPLKHSYYATPLKPTIPTTYATHISHLHKPPTLGTYKGTYISHLLKPPAKGTYIGHLHKPST